MSLTLNKPPLNEVALGYSFLPRPDILIPHIGKFWTRIEDRYPRCQHAAPIIEERSLVPNEIPLPRVWLISSDDCSLVQYQFDRLIYNWRDRETGQQYVRFKAIRAEFERVRSIFEAYVQEVSKTPIVPTGYSVTYMNLVSVPDGRPFADALNEIFPGLPWSSRVEGLPIPSAVEWKATLPLPGDHGTMVAGVQPGRLAKGDRQVLKFEISVNSGSLGGRQLSFDEWAASANEWVNRAFEGLTSEDVRINLWQQQP